MVRKNVIITMLAVALMTPLANAQELNNPVEKFDVNSVEFVEDDQDLDLGFDTATYLPENFDPYSGIISVKAINYIDICDEVDLGFETNGYLPTGFDPYIQ
nr:hypothetical protein [Allomuricauda sp.]